jgi:DNA-binding transcriptional MerR regulator/methylmalonyl-CoA mutase cobalamin-binding subunit
MSEYQHSIQAVARRTGLSAHVIRIWEKRYGAVTPERTGTNRRLYSDAQIARLTLLREITQAGQSISSMATLPLERLQQIAAASVAAPLPASREARPESPPAGFLPACLDAVRALDSTALEGALRQAELVLGNQGMLQRVAAPLAQTIGSLWREGAITAAHEHFASAVLRHWLTQGAKAYAAGAEAPVLIVTTPSGQLHELGALLVAAAAANLGWRVVYLGASLPAAEIAGAARQQHARAVALSLVYPEDDPNLEGELVRLRELLPGETALLAGGRAMSAQRATLGRIGAVAAEDLAQLGTALDALRQNFPSTPRAK